MTSPSRCVYAALREVRVIAQIMHFSFLSAMMMKSIYKEGNWEMEPDSQILHFHPSIFDLSLLYLMQGCWRLSRLTGVHPEQRVKPPDTTGYVLCKLLLLQQAPGSSPVSRFWSGNAVVPVCRSWCLFSWSERENLRPHSVTSHWYGFSPLIRNIIIFLKNILI